MVMIANLRAAAAATGDEFRRRAALARQPAPAGVRSPPFKLLWQEMGGLLDRRGTTPAVPRAESPRTVMLLPGFGAHPSRMARIERALQASGHKVHDWGLGFNLGPTAANFAFLIARVERIARSGGQPVVLVGWSLGGLFARELAKRRPDSVSMVITMGTPFSGDRRANNAWRAYQLITGHAVDAPPIEADFATKPPVPTVALWSPRDGIVSPRSASGWPGERDCAIALRCTHLGFAGSPQVIAEVLKLLDSEMASQGR